ncbi:MAG TPA: LysM peptidoglycan-binding domain-containing protein [Dehalococcoidia bacterium]|nr:LysM peptidoglycan-binding domain-containing protein [Dehalococcoidia bacterium]
MRRHRWSVPVLVALALVPAALALTVACGGGGSKTAGPSGELTDPKRVGTATPWASPPAVIYLQDGQLAPISPGGGQQPSATNTPGSGGSCGSTYKVQSGDNPSSIAQKCGVTLDNLLKANPNINPSNLQVGQELKIP